jgi:hypothetical protein
MNGRRACLGKISAASRQVPDFTRTGFPQLIKICKIPCFYRFFSYIAGDLEK